jgi:hypothetical protein
MELLGWQTIAGFCLTAILSAPLLGANTPLPGTLNYVEGKAQIGAEELTSKSVGAAELQTGQTITTQDGRAEILLTPGVFLRLDKNSAAEMISPSLTNTEVRVDKGRALLEVAEIHKQNDIKIAADGATTQVLKNGLYEFDANHGEVQVFDGKAQVLDKDKTLALKGGRELNVESDAALKPTKFNKKKDVDDFYNWNALRSEYASEANVQVAGAVPAGFTPGWLWDPWFSAYTFVPGNGIFYSPFGWGFYSPAWIGYAPVYYGVPYGYYRPGVGHPHYLAPRTRTAVPMRVEPEMRAHAGFGGFHGGGFRR